MVWFGSTRVERRDGEPNGDALSIKEVTPPMSVANLSPDSGLQLLIILGAGFLAAGIHPNIGMMMLGLGIGAWLFYNIMNAGRQF